MKITLTLDEDEVPVVPRAITVSLIPILDEDDTNTLTPPVRTVDLTVDEDGFRTLVDPKGV